MSTRTTPQHMSRSPISTCSVFKKYLESSKEELFEIGFPKFTTEDFHDMARNVYFTTKIIKI
ncbi:hypothetical protein E2C01_032822 [Portunus trituberculatus]|uniref:Uncharacterized protein n=1 Tax=Portunus trituberculatus TaxID=210409 RepID=A0A5B7EWX1_PORTR|nr:hypothetical protein [Portunus trituberculatus]